MAKSDTPLAFLPDVAGAFANGEVPRYNSGLGVFNPTPTYSKAEIDALLAQESDITHTHTADQIISGVFLPARLGSGTPSALNFLRGDSLWAALTAGDIPNIAESQVTSLVADLAAKVPTSRTISTTAPMTGGGALSGNLTLAVPIFLASGTSHASGLVPDPGVTGGTAKFLREDATWVAIPPDVPGGSDTYVQYNKAGAFAGNSALTFNDATGALVTTGSLGIGSSVAPLTTFDLKNGIITAGSASRNNAFICNNAYYDPATGFKYAGAGYANALYFINGSLWAYTAPSGSTGGNVPWSNITKFNQDGTAEFPGTLTALGTLTARQSGGVAGTDEVQISHNGLAGYVMSKDGKLQFESPVEFNWEIGGLSKLYSTATQLNVASAGRFGWSATHANVAQDTDLFRVSAGVIGFGQGSTVANAQLNAAGATFYDPTATTGSTLLTVNTGAGQSTNPIAIFQTGTTGTAPVIFRQTGGVAGTDEVRVYDDGTNSYVMGMNTTLKLGGGNTVRLTIDANGTKSADIFPDLDVNRNFGSTALQWNQIFVKNIIADDAAARIRLGGGTYLGQQSAGVLGIGATSGAADGTLKAGLGVLGPAAAQVGLTINLAASQTANSINVTSNGGAAGNVFVLGSDRMGLGVSSPQTKLHIVDTGGNARFRLDNGVTNSQIFEFETATSEVIFNSRQQGSGAYVPLKFATGGTRRMSIETSGRTLMGPTLPTDDTVSALQVNGTTRSDGGFTMNIAPGSGAKADFRENTNHPVGWGSTSFLFAILSYDSGNALIRSTAPKGLYLGAGANHMQFLTSGRILAGPTLPTDDTVSSFQLSGPAKITAAAATDVLQTLKLHASQSANAFEINTSGGTAGDRFNVTKDGNVHAYGDYIVDISGAFRSNLANAMFRPFNGGTGYTEIWNQTYGVQIQTGVNVPRFFVHPSGRILGNTAGTLVTDDTTTDFQVGSGKFNGTLDVKLGSTAAFASVGGSSVVRFTDVGNVGTGEDDLYSDTIAANTLAVNGDSLHGEYAFALVSSTSTKQVKLYFAGTAIFDTGALTISVAASLIIYFRITRVSNTVVRYSVSANTSGASTATYAKTGEITGLTLASTGYVLKVTGETAGVGTADNDIVSKSAQIDWTPMN